MSKSARTKAAPARVTTMAQAVALFDKTKTIEGWAADPDDETIQEFKRWLEAATRAWLLSDGKVETLTAQIEALGALVQNHVEISLDDQASLLEHAIGAPGDIGGKLEENVISAAPAARFVRVWLGHRASRERLNRDLAQIPSPDERV